MYISMHLSLDIHAHTYICIFIDIHNFENLVRICGQNMCFWEVNILTNNLWKHLKLNDNKNSTSNLNAHSKKNVYKWP